MHRSFSAATAAACTNAPKHSAKLGLCLQPEGVPVGHRRAPGRLQR
jgi:hypothetical protein